MSTKLEEAVQQHTRIFIQALREGEGGVPEAHEGLNTSNRDLIQAMHQAHGQAWLGKINLYNDQDRGRTIWQYDPAEPIYNFGASFVIPACDAELERLIRERDQTPYMGTAKDGVRGRAIMDRLTVIGGHHLTWS